MQPWGYELLLNAKNCNIKQITDKENVKTFLKQLVIDIDMVAYGEPWIERFATHDALKAGISACQMIETSNICLHLCENDGSLYLNVFSCKPFSNDDAITVVKHYFNPVSFGYKTVIRDVNDMDDSWIRG